MTFEDTVCGPIGQQGLSGVAGPALEICPRCHIFKEFHKDALCLAIQEIRKDLRENEASPRKSLVDSIWNLIQITLKPEVLK